MTIWKRYMLARWAAYLLGGINIVAVVLIQSQSYWINILIALPFVVIVVLLPTE